MKFQLLILAILIHSILLAQHPYKDSLQEVFKIDESQIFSKTDTTICLKEKVSDDSVNKCQKIIICRNKALQVIRVDKIFEDKKRFAYAYFQEGEFHLMQWNTPKYSEIFESGSSTLIASKGLGDFFRVLLMLNVATISEVEKILCGLGGVKEE